MYLEYSTDGGFTWEPLHTFDADIYAPKNAFEFIILNIPDDAKTTSTRFRWIQLNHLNDKDVWMLDDIIIKEGLGTYDYLWTPSTYLSDPTIKNPIAYPTTTTTYVLTATDQLTGCVYTDSIKVIFKEEFEVAILPTVTYCPDDPGFELKVTVTAGDIHTYSWSPNTNISDSTIPNPKVSPTTSTTYTVVITNPTSGCYRREEIYVTVPPAFSVTATQDTS
ncbi:MAG: hypothetical protein EOO89_30655, partial [Pedobacter sp.]